jgi:hypothetical protein
MPPWRCRVLQRRHRVRGILALPSSSHLSGARRTGLNPNQERQSGDWPQRLLQGRECLLAGADEAVLGLVEVDDDRDEKPEQD